MTSYIIRRILLMILTLFGMSVIIFALLRLVPGNIADILFDSAGFIDPQEKAYLEAELGLDQPLWKQYWDWISGLLTGDLGFSY
ncbi:MAG TPA: ABC transporter permease, partial [Alphaproteobacteria bacterium]|nr:ABC transporter permease [Alphaproteobacteria bacterium]